MADDGDWAQSRSLCLHQVGFQDVILLKAQVDRSRRQRPAHKRRARLREIQRAAFYCYHGGIERAGIKVEHETLRIVTGE